MSIFGWPGSNPSLRFELSLRYPKIWKTCSKCPIHGEARWFDNKDVSSNISTLPISLAHHRTPINSWKYCIPSAFNSAVMSISGAYLVTIRVLHLIGTRLPSRASCSSTFVIAFLKYFYGDIVQISFPNSSIIFGKLCSQIFGRIFNFIILQCETSSDAIHGHIETMGDAHYVVNIIEYILVLFETVGFHWWSHIYIWIGLRRNTVKIMQILHK